VIIQDIDKKTYVLSCGEKSGGRLGLGTDIGNKVAKFEKIHELKNKNVRFISIYKKHGLALTAAG